jgi:hypothetical protein
MLFIPGCLFQVPYRSASQGMLFGLDKPVNTITVFCQGIALPEVFISFQLGIGSSFVPVGTGITGKGKSK